MSWVTSVTSSISEYRRCSTSTLECDANRQFERVLHYMNIVHNCTLFRMHARCHGRRRVTLSTNDVASRLLSAISSIRTY